MVDIWLGNLPQASNKQCLQTDQDAIRNRRLSRALHEFLGSSRAIRGVADAKLFLEALLVKVNPSRCVETLFSSKARLDPIRDSDRVDISSDFIQCYSLQLVGYISDPGVKALAMVPSSMTSLWPPLIHRRSGTLWSNFAWITVFQKNGLLRFSWLSYSLLPIPPIMVSITLWMCSLSSITLPPQQTMRLVPMGTRLRSSCRSDHQQNIAS